MSACSNKVQKLGTEALSQQNGKNVNAVSTRSGSSSTSIYDIDNLFYTAEFSTVLKDERGMVCLGEMPETLNLDTITAGDEQNTFTDQPKILNLDKIATQIGYPSEAAAQKLEAKVRVKVLVDENGRVIRYNFPEENNSILQEAVAQHVESLRFRPGSKEGKPTKWWVIVPFRFGAAGC